MRVHACVCVCVDIPEMCVVKERMVRESERWSIWKASGREKQSICVLKSVARDAQKDRECSKLQPLTAIANKRG